MIVESTASPARRRVYQILGVVLRSRKYWALWFVAWAVGAALQLHRGDLRDQPYPLFNVSLRPLLSGFAGVLALFWIGWTVAAARTAPSADSTSETLFSSGMLAIHLFFYWAFTAMGFPCLNGLLDFAPLRDVPVFVHSTHTHHHRSLRSGPSEATVAYVNRIDHPRERIEIDWDGCRQPSGTIRSPFVTLRVGRGAFGFAWMAEPRCHALRPDERPLFQDVFLGRGHPMVLVTLQSTDWNNPFRRFVTQLHEHLIQLRRVRYTFEVSALLDRIDLDAEEALSPDDRKRLLDILRPAVDADRAPSAVVDAAVAFVQAQDQLSQPEYTAPRWLAAVEHAWPGLAVVCIQDGEPPAGIKALDRAGCRSIAARDLDQQVAATFFGGDEPGNSSQIFLSDGTGKRVFSAPLSDLGRRDELATRLAALRSTPAAPIDARPAP